MAARPSSEPISSAAGHVTRYFVQKFVVVNQLFTSAQHLLLLIIGLHVSTDHSVIFRSVICCKYQGAVHTFGILIVFTLKLTHSLVQGVKINCRYIKTKPVHMRRGLKSNPEYTSDPLCLTFNVGGKMRTGSFPGVKCGQGVLLTTHALLVPRSWKSRAIPLPTLWAT